MQMMGSRQAGRWAGSRAGKEAGTTSFAVPTTGLVPLVSYAMTLIEVELINPMSSSVYNADFAPQNALTPQHSQPWSSYRDDQTPWWSAALRLPCCLHAVVVYNDLRRDYAPNRWYLLHGISLVLLDSNQAEIWRSPAVNGARVPSITFRVPLGLWAAGIRLEKDPVAGFSRPYFCTSQIRAFGPPASDGVATIMPRPARRSLNNVLVVCRHGQAEHNVGAPYHPVLGPTLTPEGRTQAQQLHTKLAGLPAPDLIAVSPMRRTLATLCAARSSGAQLLHAPIIVCPFAHEVGVPEWGEVIPPPDGALAEGDPGVAAALDCARSTWPSAGRLTESAEEVAVRVRRLLDWLRQRPEHSVLLVAHATILGRLLDMLDPAYGIVMMDHCLPLCIYRGEPPG